MGQKYCWNCGADITSIKVNPVVKPGQRYRNQDTVYIVATSGPNAYSLINLETGYPYGGPPVPLDSIFYGDNKYFTLVK